MGHLVQLYDKEMWEIREDKKEKSEGVHCVMKEKESSEGKREEKGKDKESEREELGKNIGKTKQG